MTKELQKDITYYKRQFKKDHEISFMECESTEIEDMSPLMAYDIGYINALQSALTTIK